MSQQPVGTMTLHPAANVIYHRSYADLKRLQWPWRLLTVWAGLGSWLLTIPWMLLRALVPKEQQGALDDFETWWIMTFTGVITMWQDLAHALFHGADWMLDSMINTVSYLVNDVFKYNTEWILRELEHRTTILVDNGFHGVMSTLAFRPLVHMPRSLATDETASSTAGSSIAGGPLPAAAHPPRPVTVRKNAAAQAARTPQKIVFA